MAPLMSVSLPCARCEATSCFTSFLSSSAKLLGCICVLCPLLIYAQLGPVNGVTATPIPGVGHDYLTDLVDTVNPADGSLSIRINTPVPSGRGIKIPFSFNYDSNGVWQPYNESSLPEAYVASSYPRFLSTGGWTYGLPRLDTTQVTLPAPRCTYFTNFVFSDVTGARHLNTGAYNMSPDCSQYLTQSGHGDDQFSAYMDTSTLFLHASDAAGTAYTFPV